MIGEVAHRGRDTLDTAVVEENALCTNLVYPVQSFQQSESIGQRAVHGKPGCSFCI